MQTSFDLTTIDWLIVGAAAFIIGLSKSGLRGVDVLNVTLMALVFGSKNSTGIVLVLLCFADLLAVNYYNRHAQWNHLKKLMPWVLVGVFIGFFVGRDIDEVIFKRLMATIIFSSVLIMFWWEFKKNIKLPSNSALATTLGLASGFTTMVGNLAGAFSNLYFLVLKMPKNQFIGTVSWMFLFVNLFKVPFHVFSWKTINVETLKINLVLIPILVIGFFVGIRIVKRINNDTFRRMILFLTLLGAMVIFFR